MNVERSDESTEDELTGQDECRETEMVKLIHRDTHIIRSHVTEFNSLLLSSQKDAAKVNQAMIAVCRSGLTSLYSFPATAATPVIHIREYRLSLRSLHAAFQVSSRTK